MSIFNASQRLFQSWRHLFGKKDNSPKTRIQKRRFVVEVLEERQLLSVSPLNLSVSVEDVFTPAAGYVSEALTSDADVSASGIRTSHSLSGMTVTLGEYVPANEFVELPVQESDDFFASLDDVFDEESNSAAQEPDDDSLTYAEYLENLSRSQNNEPGAMMSCGCGCGCGCGGGCGCGACLPILYSFQLSASNTNEVVYACHGGNGWEPQELFTFQKSNSASFYGCAEGCTGGLSNVKKEYRILGQDVDTYWQAGTWRKPADKTNAECVRSFTFVAMLYTDANGNNLCDAGETVLDSLSLDAYIGYAEIKTVDFTGDHGVLRTNWRQANGDWEWNNSYTDTGTAINCPEWDVNRKTNAGQYVSYGASYTRGSYVSVEAVFEVDTGGRAYGAAGYGQNMYFSTQGRLSDDQGDVIWKPTSQNALPDWVSIIESEISWTVSAGGLTTDAGISGNHTIFVTMGTPIQNYTTDGRTMYDGPVYENATTEKRLREACNIMQGATTIPQAAGTISHFVGHGGVTNMTFDWYAWRYLQNAPTLGDCGTVAAAAVAFLGQIGIAAQHELAYATRNTDASSQEFLEINVTKNSQIIATGRAELIFTGNNYEGFFTVTVESGKTWGYTCYPVSGPYESANLHLEIIQDIITGSGYFQYWLWCDDVKDSNGNVIYEKNTPVIGSDGKNPDYEPLPP